SANIGTATSGVWDFTKPDETAWRFDPKQAGGSPMLFDIGYQSFCISLFLIGTVEKIDVWRHETELKGGMRLDAPTVAIWKHYQQNCLGSLHLNYTPERRLRTDYHPLELNIAVGGTR